MSSFAYNDVGIVSFDDERSICLKTEYVINNDLGGFIILELGGDLLEKMSTPLLDAMNLKLLNTGLSCSSNAFMESLLRRAPIVHEGRDDPIIDEEVSEAVNTEEPKQEYRYICGFT
jgi:GH18 family chitinase